MNFEKIIYGIAGLALGVLITFVSQCTRKDNCDPEKIVITEQEECVQYIDTCMTSTEVITKPGKIKQGVPERTVSMPVDEGIADAFIPEPLDSILARHQRDPVEEREISYTGKFFEFDYKSDLLNSTERIYVDRVHPEAKAYLERNIQVDTLRDTVTIIKTVTVVNNPAPSPLVKKYKEYNVFYLGGGAGVLDGWNASAGFKFENDMLITGGYTPSIGEFDVRFYLPISNLFRKR